VLATIWLLVHMQPIGYVASAAHWTALSRDSLRATRIQLVVTSGGAVLALLVTTTLSIYKPRGLTRYGWRMQREEGVRQRRTIRRSDEEGLIGPGQDR